MFAPAEAKSQTRHWLCHQRAAVPSCGGVTTDFSWGVISTRIVETDLETVGDLCLNHGARNVLVARDRPTRDRLWEARRMIIEALKHESGVLFGVDQEQQD